MPNNDLKKMTDQQHEQLQILDAVFDAIISIDEQGTVLNINKSTSRLFGFTSAELMGKNINMLFSKTTAKTEASIIEEYFTIDNAITNECDREVVGKHKNNSVFPMRLSVAELPKNDARKNRYIAIFQDLSKIQLQEELFNRSQRMDALSLLAGGLAHDNNNMLAVVMGYGDLLITHLKDQPNLLKYVNKILLVANKGADITRKLLSFSRQKPTLSRLVNINDLIIKNKKVLQKTLPTIVLNIELSNNLWLTNLEAHLFEDMLSHLALNAMHAMHNGGELAITTNNEFLSAAQAINYNISSGEYVSINIEDNGCGMSADIHSKIFEPFFSTKGELGSGLGLSQVYGFIQSSGGAINVYSELDKGTRFLIYLPRSSQQQTDTVINKEHVHTKLSAGESILVVDDENQLCVLAKKILDHYGYKVLTASSGEQALLLLKSNHIDLLLSDIIMPKMSGYQLAEQVVKFCPNIKILFASGFQDEQVKSTFKSPYPLINKPYNAQVLLSSIRQCLDEHKLINSDNLHRLPLKS
jgi:PAS domain S-box-containing protein